MWASLVDPRFFTLISISVILYLKVKTILNEYGFGSAWLNQSVEDQTKFIVLFERRIKDNFIQHCFADIEASTRCCTYKDIKSIHDIEPYLQRDIHSSIRSAFTKLRLSSHRFMVERGRWMKPKVQYNDRKCTLCNDNDIQDEYHIVLKCAYYNEVRRKYIKPYYHRHPSMYKFQELMNKSRRAKLGQIQGGLQRAIQDSTKGGGLQ